MYWPDTDVQLEIQIAVRQIFRKGRGFPPQRSRALSSDTPSSTHNPHHPQDYIPLSPLLKYKITAINSFSIKCPWLCALILTLSTLTTPVQLYSYHLQLTHQTPVERHLSGTISDSYEQENLKTLHLEAEEGGKERG